MDLPDFSTTGHRVPMNAFARTALLSALLTTLPMASGDDLPVRQGPRTLKGGEHGVGQFVPDGTLTDLEGQPHKLSDLASAHDLVVIAMTSTSCPLSKKYLPTLVSMASEAGDSVAWVIVNTIATDDPDAMRIAADRFDGHAIYGHDPNGEFAANLGAEATTDVIVINRWRTAVYHGAIDDQYGFGYTKAKPQNEYLADALAALKAGQQPLISATDAPGCRLKQPSMSTNTEVTYHNRVSRIVQKSCVRCHNSDGVGPFSLASYDEVTAHAGMIEEVVKRDLMPPWFAADDKSASAGSLSRWVNDCSLAESEKRDFLSWLAGSMPAGDSADAPQPLVETSDWQIGEPDVVFQFAEPQPVKATGVMPYQNVDVQTDIEEDKWVQAIEVKPGDRGVVHHVLVFAEDSGKKHSERDGFWGIYVPGNSALIYPDGFAKRLPKNAKLRFQMHYTPNGTATTDRTSIGLIFAKEPPQHEVRVTGIFNDKIQIPAGAENHPEVATLPIPGDARVLGFLPHMHLRGKAARYELVRSGEETTTLLDVPRYDFNWQLLYRYRDPLQLNPGDTIRFTSWYDNSENNPANPDPTRTVGWGPQTYDEMQVGYVEYYIPGEVPTVSTAKSPSRTTTGDRTKRNAALFQRLDVNADGVITKPEVRQQMPENPKAAGPIFDQLDANNNGELTRDELARLP